MMRDIADPEREVVRVTRNVEWREVGMKAALCGGIAAGVTMLLLPDRAVSLFGISVPQSIAIGVGCAAGSVAGDAAHEFLLPHIPQSAKYLQIESAAVSVGASIAGAYVALEMIGDVSLMTPVLLGGGSYVGADYLYRYAFDKEESGFLMY